jgi:hypothetical protein
VLALEINPDDAKDCQNLLIEAGLLVSFMVDGRCSPVTEAHKAFKRALAARAFKPSQVKKLTQALYGNESVLRANSGE